MLQRLAVAEGRPHADGDARQAGDRLDNAKQLRRPEHAAELAEARHEIGDPHLPALTIGEHGRDDRGVADIFGLKLRQIVEHDVGKSLLLRARQQPAEDRIAVEARIAPPHHARAGIDQSGRSPVPDDGQIQPVILHSGLVSAVGDDPREPQTHVLWRVEMTMHAGNDAADGESEPAEIRNDAEDRLVGRVVADENRMPVVEWRVVHQLADGGRLAHPGRLDLEHLLARQHIDAAGAICAQMPAIAARKAGP